MKYQETGRFGRITKHLRKQGHEDAMPGILYDSPEFPRLPKAKQARYVETVVDRMVDRIGEDNTRRVLFECGAQCCGRSWSAFSRQIWDRSRSLAGFIADLNRAEEKYNTRMSYLPEGSAIIVERTRCICGLINKGLPFDADNIFCTCSIGHMQKFFRAVLDVESVTLVQTIASGADTCEWRIVVKEPA